MILSPSDFRNGKRRGLLRWSGWFFFANWLLLLLISTRYLGALTLPEAWGGRAFTALAFVGHFASIAFVPMLIVLPLVLLWPRRQVIVPLAVALGWLTAAVIFADTAVFSQFRFHINGMVVGLLFGGAAGEIFTFTWVMWALIAAIMAGLAGLEVAMAWGAGVWAKRSAGRPIGLWVGWALVAAFVAENTLYAWANAQEYTPITRQARYLPGYQPANVRGVLAALGIAGPAAGPGNEVPVTGTGLDYPQAPMRCEAKGAPPNILFLVIDSWRADTLDARVTPNLDALAKDSWRFEHHFSGGNESRPGIFSLFYGIPATYWHEMLAERRGPVLMDELLRAGYEPLIYASAKLTSPEFDRTVFAAVSNLRTQSQGEAAWERDRTSTDEFIARLPGVKRERRPFFGFLFYDTPHGSYTVPPGYPHPFQPYWDEVNYLALGKKEKREDREAYFNRYKTAVNYTDSLAGKVLAALREQKLMDNTIVIVTGDHGEEFNDTGQGYWGHTSNFGRFQTEVPFLVRWPGRPPRAFAHRSSHLDVAPTLLEDALGCVNPIPEYSTGRLLTDTSPRDFLLISAYNRFAVVQEATITEYFFAGLVESYDPDYRELHGAKPDPAVIGKAMEQVGRFYAR